MSNIIIPSGGDDGYQIQRSLRLRASAGGFFNRTPAGAGSQTTWCLSLWLKRGALGTNQTLFHAGTNSGPDSLFYFGSNDTFDWLVRDAGTATVARKISTQVFRDPSAHGHFLFVWDTTNANAALRMRVYYNGTEITAFSTSTNPALNLTSVFNAAVAHRLGYNTSNVQQLDGYLSEINFIDGQALTPASFGQIDPVTGVWAAKKYAGTYGTNGFYLPFTDNSAATAAAIGKDFSGNGNNWTPNNISVTAGATYDSMLDVPLGADGAERGNYAVLNPLDVSGGTSTEGNLLFSGANNGIHGTTAVPAGAWYWEFTVSAIGSGANIDLGIQPQGSAILSGVNSLRYRNDGNKLNGGSSSAYGATFTSGDVIGAAFDVTNGTLAFYKNGVSQGTAFTAIVGEYVAYIVHANSVNASSSRINFGQRPFAYTPPTGFKALHTGNLPDPVIKLPAQYMAATTYTGNGGTQSISNAVNGVGFQPDLVWGKLRSTSGFHRLSDSVRGADNTLSTNTTDAEAVGNGLVSFDASGFTMDSGTNINQVYPYIAWQWKANGAAVSNTAGSITSQVSAGVTQGMSVVTYTGTGSAATVGHGLGVKPSMIIFKSRNNGSSDSGIWPVYHGSRGATKVLQLQSTSAEVTAANFNNAEPTSSVFSVGAATSGTNAGSSATYVAYCFSEVAGYSKFGSYTGNGSADGPFVFCGFRPRFVMVKRTDTASSWEILDSARDTYNAVIQGLQPNLSNAESSPYSVDFTSNGFKARITNTDINASGGTYIFAAFAENPFKYSLAR